MKNILSFVIGLIVFASLVYFLDGWLVSLVIGAFPASAQDWLPLIRITTWIIVLWTTFGICVLISSAIAAMVMFFFTRKELKRHIDKINRKPSKSKWEEKLEEMRNRR